MSEMESSQRTDSATIKNWILELLSNQGYDTAEVNITGTSEKGEGYVGDVAFARVLYTKNEENGVLDVVVKSGKPSKSLRQKFPLHMAFEREVLMYDTIVPLFQRLEAEHRLDYLKNFVPKCYGTILGEDEEVLLLQNLKSAGYELHDRFQTLNMDHLKLTLEHYGRLHALGMAYKHKNPEEFRDKFSKLPCILTAVLSSFSHIITTNEKLMFSILNETGKSDLSQRLKAKFPSGFLQKYREMIALEEENCTLIHGDCWNNNFMFKYHGLQRSKPAEVMFLDFQVVRAGSPILDLSYHLYSTASAVELDQFDVLLKTYHQFLAKCLMELNCDPERIFPLSELRRQWKDYSAFGFVIGTSVLPMVLADKDNVIEIHNMDQQETMDQLGQAQTKNRERLASRLLAAAKHFVDST